MSKEYVIPIVLNLFGSLNGSGNENVEEEQEKRIEEEPVNRTFVCEKHNEKTTHYCKTCKKLICGFDIVPLNEGEKC